MAKQLIFIILLCSVSLLVGQPALSANPNVYTINVDDTYKNMGIVEFGKNILKKFYEKYPEDKYDFITIYTDFNSPASLQSQSIKDQTEGIGKITSDDSKYFNSLGRLKNISLMHNIDDSQMPFTFNIEKDYQFFEQIAHETSHYWLVFNISDGQNCTQLNNCKGGNRLTTGYNHWSTLLNTCTQANGQFFRDPNAGGCWQDNNNGTFTLIDTQDKKVKFSSLSLYLAGLAPKDQTGNTFIIETNYSLANNTITGVKKQVLVSDIIKYTGSERVPNCNNSQKHFNMAFILALNNKSEMTAEQSQKMNYLADNFPAIWNDATYGISTMNSEKDDYEKTPITPEEKVEPEEENNVSPLIDINLSKRLSGKLLLQVEDKGRIWYVNPGENKRYEVTFANAMTLFQKLSLGVKNSDLYKIAIHPDSVKESDDRDSDGFSDKSEVLYSYNPDIPSNPTRRGNDKMIVDKNLSERLRGKLLLQIENKGRIWYVDFVAKRWEVTWKNLMDLFRKLALGVTNNDLNKIPEGR